MVRCEDCDHCDYVEKKLYSSILRYWYCIHSKGKVYSPVSIREDQDPKCSEARHIHGFCGPDGKYWEEKVAPPPIPPKKKRWWRRND